MSRDQYEKWIRTIPTGICVFCHPDKYPQTILYKTQNWAWIAALSPYWKYHTMLIPFKHYVDIDEFSDDDLHEMIKIFRYARDKFLNAGLKYDDGKLVYQYLFFWRIRDRKTVGNVASARKPSHFHLHLAPDRDTLIDPIMDNDAYSADLRKLVSS